MAIDLATVPTETTVASGDKFYFNDVSETPDALNDITASNLAAALLALGNYEFLRTYLSTDLTINNNAALANTALSVTVTASGVYQVRVVLHSTIAVKGLLLDFGGTATVTNFVGQYQEFDQSSGAVWTGKRVTSAGTDFTGTNASLMTTFDGTLEVNAGGTFIVRAAQNVANASNTVILRGSSMMLTRLA